MKNLKTFSARTKTKISTTPNMTSRIAYSAKGKGIANYHQEAPNQQRISSDRLVGGRGSTYQFQGRTQVREKDFSAPPPKRIRAPVMDTTDLIEENQLTLMGRLTNPSVQRLWSLIPFLSNRWNLRGKALGSDLGNGCFQFIFEFEEDLTKVLDNRPYHFDQWMVILQRWEPVISPTFPSLIPFWVDLQGLPKHYWKQQLLFKIGEELGEVLDHEISATAAKIRLQINGLEPLTKATVVEFPDGQEALVTLDYKNLKKHCKHCQRLSHEMDTCPGLGLTSTKSSSKGPPPQVKDPKKTRQGFESNQTKSRSHPKDAYSSQAKTSVSRDTQDYNKRRFDDRDLRTSNYSSHKSYGHMSSNYRRSPPRSLDYSRRDPTRDHSRYHSATSKSNLQWREKTYPRDTEKHTERAEYSTSSRARRPPLERTSFAGESSNPPIPIPTTEEVMGELREVTVEYTNCADPTESLARKQRVLQGEARGLMAETAEQIIASASRNFQVNPQSLLESPADPRPRSAEESDLPILNTEAAILEPTVVKKKRGRPPLAKPANRSPRLLTGAKSSKRNKVLTQNSPKRRPSPPLAATQNNTKRKPVKQRLSLPDEEAGPSTARIPNQAIIIPAIVKPRVDFHNPHLPLP